jgi:hypothetical protein
MSGDHQYIIYYIFIILYFATLYFAGSVMSLDVVVFLQRRLHNNMRLPSAIVAVKPMFYVRFPETFLNFRKFSEIVSKMFLQVCRHAISYWFTPITHKPTPQT